MIDEERNDGTRWIDEEFLDMGSSSISLFPVWNSIGIFLRTLDENILIRVN